MIVKIIIIGIVILIMILIYDYIKNRESNKPRPGEKMHLTDLEREDYYKKS